MADNKFKGKIGEIEAQDTNLGTMFQGEHLSTVPSKPKYEKATKTKLLSMKPSIYEKINVIATAKGYDLNAYINKLIEADIHREARNMEQYEAEYQRLMEEKKNRKQKREASREYNRLKKEQESKEEPTKVKVVETGTHYWQRQKENK